MALKFDFSIDQGASLEMVITIANKTFENCTGRCQIRKKPSADSPTVASPVVTFPVVVGTNGQIQLNLTDAETLAMPITSSLTSVDNPELFYYDVLVTDDNDFVTKEAYGIISLIPTVTR